MNRLAIDVSMQNCIAFPHFSSVLNFPFDAHVCSGGSCTAFLNLSITLAVNLLTIVFSLTIQCLLFSHSSSTFPSRFVIV